jgi:hypothetical protein
MRARLAGCAGLALTLLAAQPFSLPSRAAEPIPALAAARQRMEAADYRITGRLVRVDGDGKRTSLGLEIKAHWFAGILRVLVDVNSPAEAREHILLEMRPSGEHSIRIAKPGDSAAALLPFEQWSDGPVGPGFSYEDFLESQYFWPTQSVTEKVRWGARDCDILKSAPGTTDRTHYAEVRTWLDRATDFPVYVEKTLKGSGTVKEFTSFGLRHDQGVWSASQVEVKTHSQAGSTLLIFDRGSAKAKLTAADFSAAKMTHF